jgi:D-arabinose 1-dehydrogenase-like Zn-dependent alcohol dehydrogenase
VFSPAKIIGVDVDRGKMQLGQHLGADATLESNANLVDEVRRLTDGLGADLVMDCVGVEPVPSLSLEMLKRGGVYSVLGADTGKVCCGTLEMTGRELSLRGNLVGTLGELAELVQIVIRNRLVLAQSYYPLDKAAEAIEDLRNGRVDGRAVIVP